MTPEEIADVLAAAGMPDARATPITGGWASWTFDVDGEWILRVARNEQIARCHRREARLLPILAERLAVAVPEPTIVAERAGRTFMLYRRLPGRAFRAGDPLDSLAATLRDLHGVPVDVVADALGDDARPGAWRASYERDRDWITGLVLPELDADLAAELTDRFDAALSDLDAVTPVLVHRDLGLEHVLVDDATGRVSGLIDFETATVGDAAIDAVGVLVSLGERAARDVMGDAGSAARRRLRFYHWMGAVHAIRYGVEIGDDEIVADGVAGLRRRLGSTEVDGRP